MGGGIRVEVNEEVFGKIQKKIGGVGGVWSGGRVGWVRVDVNVELKFL